MGTEEAPGPLQDPPRRGHYAKRGQPTLQKGPQTSRPRRELGPWMLAVTNENECAPAPRRGRGGQLVRTTASSPTPQVPAQRGAT